MKKVLLVFIVLILTAGSLWAVNGTVQIGSGTSTNTNFPIYSCYGYNYSQQIYLGSEITAAGGLSGNINKIRFYYASSGTSYSTWSNWTIYLGNSTKTTFTSATDWVPVGSMTQVFSGTIPTPVAGTWIEITLTTPFNYTGNNLIVAVDENSASYSCTAAFRSFASGSNRGILYYSDSTNPDPTAPPSANFGPNATLAQVQFDMVINPCLAPTDPATALTFPTVTKTSIAGSFTASVGGANKYLVVRSLNSSLSANPVNGTVYTVGGSLGGGVVDYYGTSTTWTSTTLFPGTTYYYFIFPANDAGCAGGPAYKTDVFLSGSQATLPPTTIESNQSGAWSATSTWVGGVVPTVNDNAVIKTGHTVTIDATTNTCLNLTVETGASLTHHTTGTTYKLTVSSNIVNNGTIDFYNAGGTVYNDLTFTGVYNATVTGTGTMDVSTITMNKGTSNTIILELNVPSFSVKNLSASALGFLTLTNGTFKFSGTNTFSGVFFTTAGYTVASTAGFWLNNPNVTVIGQNGTSTWNGMFRMSNGTFNSGTNAGNSMTFGNNSTAIIEGGLLNAASRFAVASSSNIFNFTMSGGAMILNMVGNTSTSVPTFDFGTSTSSTVSMTGGSITLQLACTGANLDFRGPATGLGALINISGTTLYLGNANSGAARTYYLAGQIPPLVLYSGVYTCNAGLFGGIYYHGNLTIPAGSTFYLSNAGGATPPTTPTGNGIWVKGDLTNNGTMDATVTNARVDFANALFGGTAAQTYSGSGTLGLSATSQLSLGINNAASVTINSPIYATRNNLFRGNVVNANNITIGNGTSNCTIQVGVSGATYTGGTYLAAPSFNLGAGTLILVYEPESTPRTTGFEIPPSRSMLSLSINNVNGVTLSGGNATMTGTGGILYLTAGLLNTSSSNNLVLDGTTISGGSSTSFINGPVKRIFASGLNSSGTFSTTNMFPVGKGTSYLPLWIDPTTTAGGTVTFSGEAFTSNSGTMGAGVLSLSSNRWEALITAGNANFTNAHLKIGDAVIASTNKFLQSNSAGGVYSGAATVSAYTAGTPNTLNTSVSSIPFDSYYGYFAYGDLQNCAAPAGQPNTFQVAQMTTTSFTGSFSPPSPAASNYLVVRYASGATPTAPTNYTVYSVGGALGTGTVRSISNSTVFFETGLVANTTYNYYVYAYNNSGCYGPVYNLVDPLYAVVTTCPTAINAPTGLTFTGISSTGFTASWTLSTTSTGLGYTIDVATNASFTTFVPGWQNHYLGVDINTATIGSLTANTTYYIRVSASQSTCYSPYLSGSTTTLCNGYSSFPYLESFSAIFPACWRAYEGASGASYHWATASSAATHGPAAPAAGTHFMWEYVYNSTTGYNPYYLQTPPFTFDPAPKVMKYYYWLGTNGYHGTTGTSGTDPYPLTVQASTDGGTTWTDIYYHGPTSVFATSATSPWTQVTLDLTAYTDMTVMFRFKTMSNWGSGFTDQGIDEVKIEDMAPELMVTPGSLNFGYVGSGSSPQQSYLISGRALKGSPGGDVTVTGNSNFEVSLTSGGPWSSSVLVPFSSATLPPTPVYARFTPSAPNTTYTDVIGNQGGAAPNVNVSVTGTSLLSYCTSAATSATNSDVFNVQIGTGGSLVNNTSNCVTPAPGPGSVLSKYANYMTIGAPEIMRGETYAYSVSIGTCESNVSSGLDIYIDWNQNGLYTDAGEQVYHATSTTTAPYTKTGTFTVPLNATLGETGMRVICVDGSTTIAPCGTYTSGETEDYKFTIINFPAGNIQGNITDCAGEFPVDGVTVTFSIFSTTTNGDGDYLLTDVPIQTGDLTFSKSPDYFTKVVPNITTVLNQTISIDTCITFITCHEPTNLSVPGVTGTTATVAWVPSTLSPYNLEWIVEWGLPGFQHGAGLGVAHVLNTASYTITGLSGVTQYQAYVRTFCGVGDSSIWVGPISFTTACANEILSTTPGSRCGTGTVVLAATGSPGTQLRWYTAITGGTQVGTGSPFTTPSISTTTSYWVGSELYGAGGNVNVGNGTSTNGSSGYPAPYGFYYNSSKHQMLYLASELTAAGVQPGIINYLGFNVTALNGCGPMPEFTIKMGHTSATSLTTTFLTGLTTVYGPLTYTPVAGTNIHNFTTNFVWDGVSNILIDVCFNNYPNGYTNNASMPYTVTSFNSVAYSYDDYRNTCPDATADGGTSTYRTNIILPGVGLICSSPRSEVVATVVPPPALTVSPAATVCPNGIQMIQVTSTLGDYDQYLWSPAASLFTDAGCTVAYTSGTSASTVYFKSATSGSVTYTCSASNTVSLCSNTATTTMTVIPASTVTATPAAICISGTTTLGLNPATGYGTGTFQWQESFDGNNYSNITGANGSTYVTNTLTTTTYYRCLIMNGVGSVCSAPAYTVNVNNPQVVNTTPGTRCGVGTVTLGATGTSGAALNWYAASTGGSSIGTGPVFVTPSISTTTSYFVAASSGGSSFSAGLPAYNAAYGTWGSPGSSGYGLYFTTTTAMTLVQVYAYPFSAGTCTIQLQDGSGVLIPGQEVTVTFGAGDVGLKTLIPLNFVIPSAGSYRLMNTTGVYLYRYNPYSGPAYPLSYGGGALVITQGSLGTGTYYSFFDWLLTTGCESARTPVLATVLTAPAVTANATPNPVCAGNPTLLEATSPNTNYTYIWNPGGLSGATQTVYPTGTTTYTVSASDAGTGCQNEASVIVTVPDGPVCISPASPSATSAQIDWTPVGSETAWEYAIGASPFPVPTGAGTPTAVHPVTVSGLLPNTAYTFYVRAACDGGGFTSWSTGCSFTTPCTTASLPYAENFDLITWPACWTQTSDISPRWSVAATTNAGGAANEMFCNYASGTGVSRLISPALNTTGVTDLVVSFRHFFDDYGSVVDLTYKLQSSSDGINWTDESWSGTNTLGNVGPAVVTTHVVNNLGSTTYLAWVLDGNHFDTDGWWVDNVMVIMQPTIDLAFSDFYQVSGMSAPVSGTDMNGPVSLTNAQKDGRTAMLSNHITGVSASDVNNTVLLPSYQSGNTNQDYPGTPIQIAAEISNLGLVPASYTLDWAVGGVAQATYTGPSVPVSGTDIATLTFNPFAKGTFMTTGNITVVDDEVPANDTAIPFRTRVYPDVFTRTVYDRGDNIVDTYVGWGSATVPMKAGVRFTATSDTKLAGVDMIIRTETAPLGTIQVQVRAAGTTTAAPGAVLYTKDYSTLDYQPGGGDLVFFPFGTDAPIIATGSDYWITVKAPLGILYPGGAHNTGFTAGHSYYESQPDTTVWSALIITTERAWIMRAVNTTPVSPPAVFDVTGTGSYCEGATGLTVTLSGSEVGVDYQLKKDGSAFGATIPGTGALLTWNGLLAGTYTVDGTNAGGTTPMNGSAVITENPLPDDAGIISGPAMVTQGETHEYSVAPIANATGYTWSFPTGTVINAGDNTYAVTVTFASTAPGAAVVKVNGTNACGNGVVSPDFNLTVLPACQEPTGVGATTIGLTTATIFWVAPVPAPSDGYDYEVRTSGAPGSGSTGLAASGSTIPGVTNALISGLTMGTTYSVYVRSNCGDGEYSTWTPLYSFSTIPSAILVSGVVAPPTDTCYNADVITVAGDPPTYTVMSGGIATFLAGSKVSFLKGTTVNLGGKMTAKITTTFCGYAPPPIPGALTGEAEPVNAITTALFTIYPNPTNGNFTLVQKGEKAYGAVRVEVFSMKGEKVLTETIIGEKKHEVTFSDLPGGLYFVKVVADGYVETIKLVKTR